MSKTVAYLVVCWNNRSIIDECLDSILKQDYPHKKIYVIDNNSSDGSAEHIREKYPAIMLIASKKNNGFSIGNNLLTTEALKDDDTAYVALINSDAVLEKSWTSEIINYTSKKKKTACAQGVTLDYYDHSIVDAEHIYVGDNFQSVQYKYGEKFDNAYAVPRKVFGVNAAAAIYTREFIEDQPESVLFDKKFYMYLEDVDIAFRSVISGWSNYFVPSAKAYHMGSVSSKKRAGAYNIYMTFRNQSALLFKNLPFFVFIQFLPVALRFEKNFYRHLKNTQGRSVSRLALKGRIVGILRIPLYVAERIRIQSRKKISNAELKDLMKNKGIY